MWAAFQKYSHQDCPRDWRSEREGAELTGSPRKDSEKAAVNSEGRLHWTGECEKQKHIDGI